ncbi:MAG: pre-peptidase C-terminal domain-containing protein [Polyangiaceae bacterium]|nr:pre-peptidase C-terminal domain-containing protein [Polyangiaceae bacterium]
MRSFWLLLPLPALLSLACGADSLSGGLSDQETRDVPNQGGSAGSGFAGASGQGGSTGAAAGQAGSGPPLGASAACLECIRRRCLNCPENQDSATCENCSSYPGLCDGFVSKSTSGHLVACICETTCQNVCGGDSTCAAPGQEGPGAGGTGGTGGAGAVGGGGGSGGQAGSGFAGAPDNLLDCFDGEPDAPSGQVDCDEARCAPACADPCEFAVKVVLSGNNPTASLPGLWKGHTDAFVPSCTPSSKTGPDIVYQLVNQSEQDAYVRVTALSEEGDVVLSQRASCKAGSQDIPCRNQVGVGGQEEMVVQIPKGGSTFVLVGSTEPGAAQSYTFGASLLLPQCGDGKLTPDEECDSGEGCSNCKVVACEGATPIEEDDAAVLSSAAGKATSVLSPSCTKPGSVAGEQVYSIRAKKSGWLQAVLRSTSGSDATLSLWSSCLAGGELACSDRGGAAAGALERLVAPVIAGEQRYVVVESYSGEMPGFELSVGTFDGECGDKILAPVEQCDDDKNPCNPDCTTADPLLLEQPTLPVELEPNDALFAANPAKGNEKKSMILGRIAPAGDSDWFSFSAPAGSVEIAVEDPGDGSCKNNGSFWPLSGVLDSELRLFSSDGVLLARNDNGPVDGFCSRISAQLAAGTYIVQVSASSAAPAQVFSYRLLLNLPLSGTSMQPRHLLPLLLLPLTLACAASSAEDSTALTCPEDAVCPPSGGRGGSGGSGVGGSVGAGMAGSGGQGAAVSTGGNTGGSAGSGEAGSSGEGGAGGAELALDGACDACNAASCSSFNGSPCTCELQFCKAICEKTRVSTCKNDVAPGGPGENCYDTSDNDDDGLSDCDDKKDCDGACGTLCGSPGVLQMGSQVGSLAGHQGVFGALCVPSASLGKSVAYQFIPAQDGWLTVALKSDGDMALSAHQGACVPSGYSYCRNEVGVGGTEKLTIEVKEGTPVFVLVSSADKSTSATFSLTSQFEAPVCGDGRVSQGEKCDDGNTVGNDGCSADCQVDACDGAESLEDPPVLGKVAKDPAEVEGNLAASKPLLGASCAKLGVEGPEKIYAFRAAHTGRLEASLTPATADMLLAVYTSCEDSSELSCSDMTFVAGQERVSLEAKAGQQFYLAVKGATQEDEGAFVLRAQTLPVFCGDGIVARSVEQCDPQSEEKNCEGACTRLATEGDAAGVGAVAKMPASGVALGRIFPAGDTDRFQLQVLPGKPVSLQIQDPTVATDCAQGRLDSQLEVFDSSGLLVAFNDDAKGKGTCSGLTLSTPGTYLVHVRASQRAAPVQVFSYRLVVAAQP